MVGHSFGGLAISGAVDRLADRIRHLVYLDGLVLESGKSPFGILAPEVVAARRKLADEHGNGVALPAPAVVDMGIPEDHPLADWMRRRLTPHPISTYESALKLKNPIGNGRPHTYIQCTAPIYPPLEPVRQWLARQKGWRRRELATGHDAMITAPGELAAMLTEIE